MQSIEHTENNYLEVPCKSTVKKILKILQELTELVKKSDILLAHKNNVHAATT